MSWKTRLLDAGKKVVHWPFFPVFVIAVALILIGERFPFSPFPMYSGFSEDSGSTSVVYVTDARDQPLAIRKYFLLDASKVKKNYVKTLDKICRAKGYGSSAARPEDIQESGRQTLEFLRSQVRGAAIGKKLDEHGLRIYRTHIARTQHGIEQSTEFIGGTP